MHSEIGYLLPGAGFLLSTLECWWTLSLLNGTDAFGCTQHTQKVRSHQLLIYTVLYQIIQCQKVLKSSACFFTWTWYWNVRIDMLHYEIGFYLFTRTIYDIFFKRHTSHIVIVSVSTSSQAQVCAVFATIWMKQPSHSCRIGKHRCFTAYA